MHFRCKKIAYLGHAIRSEIFALIEKVLLPLSTFSCEDFTSLYVKIDYFYSNSKYEKHWITVDNITEQEWNIGLRFRERVPFNAIYELYAHHDHVPSAKRVLNGLNYYRVNVFPHFFGDKEPDSIYVRTCMTWMRLHEKAFCTSFYVFHSRRFEHLSTALRTTFEDFASHILESEETRKTFKMIKEQIQSDIDFEKKESQYWEAMRDELEGIHDHEYNSGD